METRDRSQTDPVMSRELSVLNGDDTNVTVIKNFIVTDQRLGRGSSATVYLGYHRKKKVKVAVKKFEIPPNNPRVRRRAHREMELLQRIKHPNIVRLYDVYFDNRKNDIYLFLEYCPRGSMKTFLGRGGYMEETHARRIMRQLCSALKYLIQHRIYHRDIKPQNLLLSKNYNLKVSDFGLATMNMKGTFRRLCGSPLYMAPEILLSGSYNKRSDLWSIGIVLFEFLFGHHPFKTIRNFSDLVAYVRENVDIKLPPDSKPKNTEISEECLDLLRNLLIADPQKRITWENFFHHPWLRKSRKFIDNEKKIDDQGEENDGKDNNGNDGNDNNNGHHSMKEPNQSAQVTKDVTNEPDKARENVDELAVNVDEKKDSLNLPNRQLTPSIFSESPFMDVRQLVGYCGDDTYPDDMNDLLENTYDSVTSNENTTSIDISSDTKDLEEKTQSFQKMMEMTGSSEVESSGRPGKHQVDLRFADLSPEVYLRKNTVSRACRRLSKRDNERLQNIQKDLITKAKLDIIRPLSPSDSESDSGEPKQYLQVRFTEDHHAQRSSPHISLSADENDLVSSEPSKKKDQIFSIDQVIRETDVIERRMSMAGLEDPKALAFAMLRRGCTDVINPRFKKKGIGQRGNYRTLPLPHPLNAEVFHVSLGQSPAQLHYST